MRKSKASFTTDVIVSKFYKDVKPKKTLNSQQETEVAIRIKNGDPNAINELVEANLRFVIRIAKDYQNNGLSLSDLISEGNYGLIKAAYRFDHTKGFKFISYAVWWIRQSILHSLNENARTIRLPVNMITKLTQLRKELDKFEALNERSPVYGEVLDNDLEHHQSKCISLSNPINEEGDEYGDILTDRIEKEEPLSNKIKMTLKKTLDILDKREREIVESYFGICEDCEPMTLEAIGERYGLTKERVRQIKHRAIMKLKHNTDDLVKAMRE